MKDMERGIKHKRDSKSPEFANKLHRVDSAGLVGQLPFKMATQVLNSLPESLLSTSPDSRSDTEFEFKPIDIESIKKACGKKSPDFVPGLVTALSAVLRGDMLEVRKDIRDISSTNDYWMSFTQEMSKAVSPSTLIMCIFVNINVQ